MKSKLIIVFAFLILISIFLLVIGYSDSEKEKLTAIDNGISMSTNQLMNHQGMTYMGLAGVKDKRFFKVLIRIDREKLSFEEFKEIIISYVSSIATYASENDWKQELKPYNFIIEEMVNGNETPIILVEKTSGTTEITWKTEW